MKTGATPAILTPLMQSSETVIQANALKILAVCVKKGTLNLFLYSVFVYAVLVFAPTS
jgi:hypothetical protein